jgi:hypothetical protein
MNERTVAHYRITAKLVQSGMGKLRREFAIQNSAPAIGADAGRITKSIHLVV